MKTIVKDTEQLQSCDCFFKPCKHQRDQEPAKKRDQKKQGKEEEKKDRKEAKKETKKTSRGNIIREIKEEDWKPHGFQGEGRNKKKIYKCLECG